MPEENRDPRELVAVARYSLRTEANERALVRKAFRHLVTFEGTRAVLTRDELEHLLGGNTDASRLVERLLAARLLVTSENEHNEIVVEIIHEALIGAWPRLAEWRREDMEGSRFHQQLRTAARQWSDRGRPRGLLWRGDALAEYVRWRARQPGALTPLEAAFGTASTSDAARGRRIRRALISVAIVITCVFIIILWRANGEARQQTTRAEGMVRDSYYEQGRMLVLQGDKQKALPLLRDGGSIIVTASVAHYTGNPGYSVYGAAKAAVRSFARNWAVDLKDRKIRVNCVSPGPTETPLADKMGVPPEVMAAVIPQLLAQVPLGRMGESAEVANVIAFLASDAASYVTGTCINVDGGLSGTL